MGADSEALPEVPSVFGGASVVFIFFCRSKKTKSSRSRLCGSVSLSLGTTEKVFGVLSSEEGEKNKKFELGFGRSDGKGGQL